MKLDLSILFENPELDKSAVLTIEPLAPLSIVSTLPGSYYKSQDAPTKYNLCGMFENTLGWHLGDKERKAILRKMSQVYKKKYKISDFRKVVSVVGYAALIGHLFNVSLEVKPALTRYDDLWTQQMKDSDVRHLKGTPNISWEIIHKKLSLPLDEKGKVSDKVYSTFFKNNKNSFPMYYTSPRQREFVVLESAYMYKLSINSFLFNALKEACDENNIAYLGTNEGWVHLAIKEI